MGKGELWGLEHGWCVSCFVHHSFNCSCPSSWHLLNETIDELLKVNPKCVVLSSMERRQADGIDDFIEEMRNMDHVGSTERVWFEEARKIEIYVTRGIS